MENIGTSFSKRKLRITKLISAAGGILCGLPFMVKELWLLGWIASAFLVLALFHADSDGKCSMRRAYAVAYCFFYPFAHIPIFIIIS